MRTFVFRYNIVVLLILALCAGYFFSGKPGFLRKSVQAPEQEAVSQAHTYVQNPAASEVKPPDVVVSSEKFISQSAKEVLDPGAGKQAVGQGKITGAVTTEVNKVVDMACVTARTTNFDCYQQYYTNIVDALGIEAAFTDLRQRYNNNDYVKSQCHPITHVIGQRAAAKYPKVSEAYSHGDSFCWSGYYHGVLEGIIAKLGRNNLLGQLNGVCATIPGKERYSFDYYNCVHGLGHGLMAISNDELFESLTSCDYLNGAYEQSSCYSGVFMENIIVDNKNHFTKYLKASEPLYPCTGVDTKYKETCYLMQTSYMLKVTGRDFPKVFELCGQAEPAFQPICFQSLGRDASSQSLSTVAGTKAFCALGKDFAAQSNCIIGAVKDFISYFHADVQAKNLCSAIDPDLQPLCLSTAENYYKSF